MKNKKWLGYIPILILPLFLIILVLKGLIQSNGGTEDLRLAIEWLTKYVLPWIFLYWFIKLVRKIK
ncbi:hypothetical protein [Paenibacillus lautus]|uniref:hypothetical protein n=1 Tax=Paenibacillus lautus TaxID=1401 RepID=UPI003D2A374E